MASATKTARKSSKLRKGILTFATIGAVGVVGAFASTALLTDSVSLASVAADGGTLDLQSGGADTFSLGDISNMKPGDKKEKYVNITNKGSIDGILTVSSTGTATAGCFYFTVDSHNPTWAYVFGGRPSDAKTATITGNPVAPNETQRFRVELEMTGNCTVGSNRDSKGSTAIGDRNADHAKATLNVKFDLKQA